MPLTHISKPVWFTQSMNLAFCKAQIHESRIQGPKIESHIVMSKVLAGKPQYDWYGHMCAWGIHYGCIYLNWCVAAIVILPNWMLSVDTRIFKNWLHWSQACLHHHQALAGERAPATRLAGNIEYMCFLLQVWDIAICWLSTNFLWFFLVKPCHFFDALPPHITSCTHMLIAGSTADLQLCASGYSTQQEEVCIIK